MIDFKCTQCGETVSVPNSLMGLDETCPKCGKRGVVGMLETPSVKSINDVLIPRFQKLAPKYYFLESFGRVGNLRTLALPNYGTNSRGLNTR